MKKVLVVILLIGGLAMVRPVLAQFTAAVKATDVAQAESDYRFQFDTYRNSYTDYVTTKSEFLKTGSLKTEQDALNSAKATSVARAEVLRTYTRWLMLQLLQYETPFPQVSSTSARLNTQITWYLDHKAKVQAAVSISAFQKVMDDYAKSQKNRDKLYAEAQIDLKLAQFAYFQQQARALYDPVFAKLQSQKSIPEVEQGLVKVADLGDQVNKDILDVRTKEGAIESGDMEIAQALQQTSDKLEMIRTKQLTLINTMMELETRYAN